MAEQLCLVAVARLDLKLAATVAQTLLANAAAAATAGFAERTIIRVVVW